MNRLAALFWRKKRRWKSSVIAGSFATFDLTELVESVDDGKPREFWNHSLIIISGRAAYDIFEGKFRREPWRNFLGKTVGDGECTRNQSVDTGFR